jgi:phosphoglycerate dehydrogenase-like enzyme
VISCLRSAAFVFCCTLLCAAALQAGRIRGAALDVFATEPLPSDSPLWGLPNALLTPHCSARTSRFMFDNVQLFLDNLQRYAEGRELLNVVDKTLGY